MNVQVFAIPYDSGIRGERMGAGPLRLIEGGVERNLREAGHDVTIHVVETEASFHPEVQTGFELNRKLAAGVRKAGGSGAFPLLLSGNCIVCLGAVSGLATSPVGLIWFDAHGDFNTPETSPSGFLDGMGLAALVGRCWQGLAKSVPGYRPLPEENVIHIGGRDFDDLEKRLMEHSGLQLVEGSAVQQSGIEATVKPALEALRTRVERVYIHFDFDVLDPASVQANQFAAPGGLTVEQAKSILQMIADRFTLAGAGFSAYDPQYDGEGMMLDTGIELIKTVLAVQ